MEVVVICVGIPLSVEVIVGVLALSLVPLVRGDYFGVVALSLIPLARVDLVWLSAHPSKCRSDLCCALPLV